MPRLIISKSDLPPTDLEGGMSIRLRVVSDSRNAISDWSQLYKLYKPTVDIEGTDDGNFYTQSGVSSVGIITAKISDGVSGKSGPKWNVSVSWLDGYNLPLYDIYARWYYGTKQDTKTPSPYDAGWSSWDYIESTSTKNYSFNSPYVSYERVYGAGAGNDNKYPKYVDLAIVKATYTKLYKIEDGNLSTPLTIFNTFGERSTTDPKIIVSRAVKLDDII